MFVLNGQKATSTILAVGGTGSIGIDDSVRGTFSIFGHGIGTVEGGYIDIYTNADYDATINKYQFHTDSDDLLIGPDTNPDALKYDGGLNDWIFDDTITALGTITVDINAQTLTGESSGVFIDIDAAGTLTGNSTMYGNQVLLTADITNNGKTLGISAQTTAATLDGGTALFVNGQFSSAKVTDGGSTPYAFGSENWVEVYAGGAITKGYGTKHFVGSWSTGTFATAYGTASEFWGDYTTLYGLHINMDNVSSGTKWGIFATGDAKSHLDGNLNLGAGTAYLNFGGTDGSGGYGFRDNSGIMELKNSGGSWIPMPTQSEKSWGFVSPSGTTGSFWAGDYYKFGATDNDFSPSITFGTANAAYAAHFFVVLGATAVDEITITITGTTIDDDGTRTGSDTATLTIPNGSSVNDYFETPEKWLGQITIEVTAGTAKTCNYGFAKYWDNNNTDFSIKGIQCTWLGGANDGGADIHLHHHKATGWTFSAGNPPTIPTPVASMATDHGAESGVVNNENGAWKRVNLNTAVEGSGSEGVIIEIINSVNRAFEHGTALLRIQQT